MIISLFFFFKDTATTEIYTVGNTLSLHDALPISLFPLRSLSPLAPGSPLQHRARSEEHTSELQSLPTISYAVFCLKKKKTMLTADLRQGFEAAEVAELQSAVA